MTAISKPRVSRTATARFASLFMAVFACSIKEADVVPRLHAAEENEGFRIDGNLIPSIDGIELLSKPASERLALTFWPGKKIKVTLPDGIIVTENDRLTVDEWHYRLNDNVQGEAKRVFEQDGVVYCEAIFPSDHRGWETLRRRCSRRVRQPDGSYTEELVRCPSVLKLKPGKFGFVVSEHGETRDVALPILYIRQAPMPLRSTVVRGPDWMDGYADGGREPFGELADDELENCVGIIISPVDEIAGFVEVLWQATGRRTFHRFGCQGFYDLTVVEEPDDSDLNKIQPIADDQGQGDNRLGGGFGGRGMSLPPGGVSPMGSSPQGGYGGSQPPGPGLVGRGSLPPGSSPQGGYGGSPPPGSGLLGGGGGSVPPGSSPQGGYGGSPPPGSSPQGSSPQGGYGGSRPPGLGGPASLGGPRPLGSSPTGGASPAPGGSVPPGSGGGSTPPAPGRP